MKTLVIHPSDRSTDFLKPIYEGKGWTEVTKRTGEISEYETRKLIREHDRIIMMGHGHPNGLFFTHINPSMVDELRKKECVCIWCNADQFVNRYGLHGFYTGMFISEVGEARYFDIISDQAKIDYSNYLFVLAVRHTIESKDLNEVLKECKNTYVGECPVIHYNSERLYFKSNMEVTV